MENSLKATMKGTQTMTGLSQITIRKSSGTKNSNVNITESSQKLTLNDFDMTIVRRNVSNIFAELRRYITQTGFESKATGFRKLMNTMTVLLAGNQRGYTQLEENQYHDTLFCPEFQTTWKRLEANLGDTIVKHEKIIREIHNMQLRCIKTSQKVKKYNVILFTQQSSLPHNQHQKHARELAIVASEAKISKLVKQHEADYQNYKHLVSKEMDLRIKMTKISTSLKLEITEKLHHAVNCMMTAKDVNISSEVTSVLTRRMYQMICNQYESTIPPVDPCHSKPLTLPVHRKGSIQKNIITHELTKFSNITLRGASVEV